MEFEEEVAGSVLACPTRLRNAMPLYTRGFARLNPVPVASADDEAFQARTKYRYPTPGPYQR